LKYAEFKDKRQNQRWSTFHLLDEPSDDDWDEYGVWERRHALVRRIDAWCEENIPKGDWRRYSSDDTFAIRADSPHAVSFKLKWC
jgi:hypothetical protein